MPASPTDRFPDDYLVRDRARAMRPKGKGIIATDMAGRILYWNEAAEAARVRASTTRQ